MNFKFWIAALFIAILAFPSFWKHRSNFKKLFFFIFLPAKFANQSADYSMQENIREIKGLKERIESDKNYKQKRIDELKDQFSKSTYDLRNSIYQGLMTVFRVSMCAILFAFIMTHFISLSEKHILLIQLFSGFLILWALIAKLGWSIQTTHGNTLPEQMNSFWFIFLNVIGIFCLFFTYFFNLFKK